MTDGPISGFPNAAPLDGTELIGITQGGITCKTTTQALTNIPSSAVVTTQAGTAYTLALSDQLTVIEFLANTAVTVTVPLNASVAFPIGTVIDLLQYGAGTLTINPATSGVLLRSANGLRSRAEFSIIAIRKRATDEWVIAGDTQI